MFKPNLCPNQEVKLDDIKYPMYASLKLDGNRVCFHPKLGMISRSLKQIPSIALNTKFASVLEFAKKHNIILDGELYSHKRDFQEIQRAFKTEDLSKKQKQILKEFNDPTYDGKYKGMTEDKYENYHTALIDDIMFNVFDCIAHDSAGEPINDIYLVRQARLCRLSGEFGNHLMVVVDQVRVKNADEVRAMFKIALDEEYEGLILKSPDGLYKFGRSTINEGTSFKVKPFIELSGRIIGVQQATVVREGAEKTINELGRSVTSKKKDDRVLIEKASAFIVEYNGLQVKPVIAATDAEKEQIWADREQYIGCEVLYKGMDVGAKDVPRHPVALRWWLKDE
jgi:DNA ligase-1